MHLEMWIPHILVQIIVHLPSMSQFPLSINAENQISTTWPPSAIQIGSRSEHLSHTHHPKPHFQHKPSPTLRQQGYLYLYLHVLVLVHIHTPYTPATPTPTHVPPRLAQLTPNEIGSAVAMSKIGYTGSPRYC